MVRMLFWLSSPRGHEVLESCEEFPLAASDIRLTHVKDLGVEASAGALSLDSRLLEK